MNVYILSGLRANIIKREILSGITDSGVEGSRITTDADRYKNVFTRTNYLYTPSYLTFGSGMNYSLGKNFLIGIEAGLNVSNARYFWSEAHITTGINFIYRLNTKR